MNKYFLWAVAISALCSSCETEDEVFLTAQEQIIASKEAENVEINYYQTYQSILSSFVYDNQQTNQENLLRFEQHVNHCMPYDEEKASYERMDLKQVAFLATTDATYIEHLNYSETAKTILYAVLNDQYNEEIAKNTLEPEEYRLIQALAALHNDNNGNGYDDDILNDRRTIAFAYGAQHRFIKAVLYTGAVEIIFR